MQAGAAVNQLVRAGYLDGTGGSTGALQALLTRNGSSPALAGLASLSGAGGSHPNLTTGRGLAPPSPSRASSSVSLGSPPGSRPAHLSATQLRALQVGLTRKIGLNRLVPIVYPCSAEALAAAC